MSSATVAPRPEASDMSPGRHKDWLDRGATLAQQGRSTTWAAADWALAGLEEFGRTEIGRAAVMLDLAPKTLVQYTRCAERHPRESRPDVPIAFARLTLALPGTTADELLSAAETGGWTRAQLDAAVAEQSTAAEARALKDENRRLRRQLRHARQGSAVAAQTVAACRAQIGGERRLASQSLGRLQRLLKDAGSGALEAAHGNARRSLARHAHLALDKLQEQIDKTRERITEALERR